MMNRRQATGVLLMLATSACDGRTVGGTINEDCAMSCELGTTAADLEQSACAYPSGPDPTACENVEDSSGIEIGPAEEACALETEIGGGLLSGEVRMVGIHEDAVIVRGAGLWRLAPHKPPETIVDRLNDGLSRQVFGPDPRAIVHHDVAYVALSSFVLFPPATGANGSLLEINLQTGAVERRFGGLANIGRLRVGGGHLYWTDTGYECFMGGDTSTRCGRPGVYGTELRMWGEPQAKGPTVSPFEFSPPTTVDADAHAVYVYDSSETVPQLRAFAHAEHSARSSTALDGEIEGQSFRAIGYPLDVEGARIRLPVRIETSTHGVQDWLLELWSDGRAEPRLVAELPRNHYNLRLAGDDLFGLTRELSSAGELGGYRSWVLHQFDSPAPRFEWLEASELELGQWVTTHCRFRREGSQIMVGPRPR